MCGIAGVWDPNKGDSELIPIIRQMNAHLSHRGPDASDFLKISDRLFLGHTRLSIIDLNKSAGQPMSYENRFYITYNGEIFNYLELRNELISKGHVFRTYSDTEVLLAAYAEWKEQMLPKLNGMWAFCIYDGNKNQFFFSRDRYGIKPFYYYEQKGKIYFASEIKCLRRTMQLNEYQPEVLENILAGKMNYASDARTYIKDVYQLPAAHYATYDPSNGMQVSRYYELTSTRTSLSKTEQVEHYLELFLDSVGLRMRSDVPVATCLSGGLDSSSIVSALNHLEKEASFSSNSHKCYTATFSNSRIDESQFAKELASSFSLEHKLISNEVPDPDEIISAARAMDGPMHSLAFYPIWKLFRTISEDGVKVTLDGQGPDEALGGYLGKGLVESGITSAAIDRNFLRITDVLRTTRFLSKRNPTMRHWFTYRYFLGLAKKHWGRLEMDKKQFLNKYLLQQVTYSPLPVILQQYDRCSMAHGVECRMPFMDFRLMEYSQQISESLTYGSRQYKRILRESMKGIIPEKIRMRQDKIGFNAPVNEWLGSELKEWILDIMRSQTFIENSYFDGKKESKDFEESLQEGLSWGEAWRVWPKINLVIYD